MVLNLFNIALFSLLTVLNGNNPIHSYLDGRWEADDSILQSAAFNANEDVQFVFSKDGGKRYGIMKKFVLYDNPPYKEIIRGYIYDKDLFTDKEENKKDFTIYIHTKNAMSLEILGKEKVLLTRKIPDSIPL